MSIIELMPDAKAGTRVVYSHPTFAFNDTHLKNGKAYLRKGAVYTVQAIRGDDTTAAVELKEFVGIEFALTQFDEV